LLLLAVCLLALVAGEAYAAMKDVVLLRNELKIFPVHKLKRVAVGDPKVADVSILSKTELMLIAKEAGTTSLIVWDESGQSSFSIVVIKQNLERVGQKIRELIAASDISGVRVKAEEGKAIALGEVATAGQLETVEAILKPFENTVNLVKVKERQPLVEIDCNVLEINSDDLKQLGMDWQTNLPITYSETTADSQTPKVWKMFEWERTTVNTKLNFLIKEDRARVLANPKLIALSGKEAKFLVGGEVPYVVEKDDGKTTVEWKDYGVILKIQPQVTPKNEIRTTIEAEVSDLSGSTVSHAGYNIPSLVKREVQTELFLNEGETVFFAGLIKHNNSRIVYRLPWLSKVPILGELFKTTDFGDERTELVISLTPRILDARNTPDGFSSQMLKEEAILAAQRSFSEYGEGSEMTYYSHMIEDMISHNVVYPEAARQGGEEGIVKIDLLLLANGKLKRVEVRQSSGFQTLDNAALSAVQEQAPYPSFPSRSYPKRIAFNCPCSI